MAKMTTVAFPISGRYVVTLEGEFDSKEEAIQAAWDAFETGELEDWEAHEKLVEGNVCYTYHTDVEVETFED